MEYYSLLPFAFIALLIIAFAMAISHERKLDKKRKDEWATIAKEIGFQFKAKDDYFFFTYRCFKTFAKGDHRRAKNVLKGKNGDISITIVDFERMVGSGKQRHTLLHTICIFSKDSLHLPSCYLRTQKLLLDFLGKLFGGQDIDFCEDPSFSKAFVLQGENEEAVRQVFDSKVRKGFLAYHDRDFVFEGNGEAFLVNKGKAIEPSELTAILEEAYQIMDILTTKNVKSSKEV